MFGVRTGVGLSEKWGGVVEVQKVFLRGGMGKHIA